jgi:hypothetical protein
VPTAAAAPPSPHPDDLGFSMVALIPPITWLVLVVPGWL